MLLQTNDRICTKFCQEKLGQRLNVHRDKTQTREVCYRSILTRRKHISTASNILRNVTLHDNARERSLVYTFLYAFTLCLLLCADITDYITNAT